MNIPTLTLAFSLALAGAAQAVAPDKSAKNAWLTGADSDAVRFERLQRYLRGFDQPMWEVGERYEAMHTALGRGNYELAAYHWDKIRVTIQNGYLKRPARQANSDAILLNGTWDAVRGALASRDARKAWAGFERAKAACQACHAAESVPWMNDQPMFELAAPAAKLP